MYRVLVHLGLLIFFLTKFLHIAVKAVLAGIIVRYVLLPRALKNA